MKHLTSIVAPAFIACLGALGCSSATEAETDLNIASQEESSDALTARSFVGYWTNGYDNTLGAIARIRLEADGTFTGTFVAAVSPRPRTVEETGTWRISTTASGGTLRLTSAAGNRVYAFEVLTYGQPVFGPTNPAWDAAIVVTSPQFPGLSTRLFGLNIVP